MYKLVFLPKAKDDLVDIVSYISIDAQEPDAAERLAEKLIESAEKLTEFPYSFAAYQPLRQLKHEYRILPVESYVIYFWIDEAEKTVTVARVLHERRDRRKLLK